MPVKRPIFRYAALALLFAMTLAYEVRYTRDVLRSERVDVPFFLIETATNRIAFAVPEAKRLGIHTGDQVLAIDGVPYTGSSVLGGARAQARPGVPLVHFAGSVKFEFRVSSLWFRVSTFQVQV